MKKSFILTVSFLFIIGLYVNSEKKQADSNPDFCAMLMKAQGEVFFKAESKKGWLKAKQGMGFTAGDTIKTGSKSLAMIVLEGGTVFKIEQLSEIKINMLNIKLSQNRSETELEMGNKGALLAHVNTPKKTKTQFNTKTPTGLVSVRGTGLSIEVKNEEETEVVVLEGRVIVKDFVQESGLPEKNDELLLMVLHEMSVKPNYAATVTKKGISKPKKLSEETLAGKKKELEELKAVSRETQSEWSKTTPEARSQERQKIRNAVLSEK